MNIFVISSDPKRNARMLDDKRLVKMVLETAQLLSNAVHFYTGSGPYKLTHVNHPCSVWVRESTGNYAWTVSLFKELCSEYTRRYSKTHKCESLLSTFENTQCRVDIMTEFKNCTDFKHLGVFEAYRKTMKTKWLNDKRKPSWS
jgi:hypothetical protein